MNYDPERNQLSAREEAVLRHAAEGMTDQQIAAKLDIRASTVTTYWIRIRTKHGRLSRSELVANWVRKTSNETVEALRAEIAELKLRLEEREAAVHELKTDLAELRRQPASQR